MESPGNPGRFIPSLVRDAVDARVLDRQRSGNCVNVWALAIFFVWPSIHLQVLETAKLLLAFNELVYYGALLQERSPCLFD